MWFVSRGLVLLAVTELGEPVFDDANGGLRGLANRLGEDEPPAVG